MTHRTELWVDAEPPASYRRMSPTELASASAWADEPIAVVLDSAAADPERLPTQLNRFLSTRGRRLNSVVIGPACQDLTDGAPVASGVVAHWRAGWMETADRVAGEVSELARRLNPSLSSWSSDSPGAYDPHRNDRAAAWVNALAGRWSGPTTHVVQSRWGLDTGRFTGWWMTPPSGVDRAVGFVWMVDQPDVVARVQWAGPHPHVSAHGTWWIGTPARHWPTDRAGLERLRGVWHPDVGDRECRIAFVGPSIPRAELDQAFFDATLSESSRRDWKGAAMTPDPFRGLQ